MLVVDQAKSPTQMKSTKVSMCFLLNTHLCMLLPMQVEWSKTKAHADHWDEEYILTIEEMRCTIAFLHWKAKWWMLHAYARGNVSVALTSGLSAYVHKQAAVYKRLAHSFAGKWYPLLTANSIPIKWPTEYIPASTSSTSI